MQKIIPSAKPNGDGFYSVNDALPEEYDMCILAFKDGKTKMGWRTGSNSWDGLRVNACSEVIGWKRQKQE